MIPSPGETSATEPMLAPFTDHPATAAILCDLDGTLAEIVARPELTRISDRIRVALARIADRYAATVVVTGRRATVARRIVGVQKLTYIGNHGFELLLPNAPEPRPAPELGALARAAGVFAGTLDPAELERAGLRLEDKGPIIALHWRGAPDELAAEGLAEDIAGTAERSELVVASGPQGPGAATADQRRQGFRDRIPAARDGRDGGPLRRRRSHRSRCLPGARPAPGRGTPGDRAEDRHPLAGGPGRDRRRSGSHRVRSGRPVPLLVTLAG